MELLEWNGMAILRGILGVGAVMVIAWLLSYDRKRIDWRLVGSGLLMQLLFACTCLYWALCWSFVVNYLSN